MEINTIQDIIDKIPEESLDLFLEDLKLYILSTKKTLKLIKKIVPENFIERIENKMIRIDDGKTGGPVGTKVEISF